MGYTNYWECETDFTDDEWKAICEEAQYMKEIDSSYQENMFRTLDGVDILENEICFNGVADLGCETFYLNRKATDFSFCKTREMPYDIYVWHLLTFCQMIKKDFHARRDRWYWDKSRPLPDVYKPQSQVDRSGAVK
tara:strand:+ start:86 stop:493 length:408 start_codon:yes stop_codon:yes gene_type:complete